MWIWVEAKNVIQVKKDERIKEVMLDTERHCLLRQKTRKTGPYIHHSSSEEKRV
jgi:hypothetical protein